MTQVFIAKESADFNAAKNFFKSTFLGGSDANLAEWLPSFQPAHLVLQGLIDPSKNTITFQTTAGTNNTDLPDELRLDKNDMFISCQAGLFLQKVGTNSALGQPARYNWGNAPLYAYADATAFPGTRTGFASEASALETIYNGKLSLKSGNFSLFDQVRTGIFKRRAEAQQTGPVDLAAGLVSLNGQRYVLFGNQNYTLELTYGTGDRTIADGSYDSAGSTTTANRNAISIVLSGYKIVGAAAQAFRVDPTQSRF